MNTMAAATEGLQREARGCSLDAARFRSGSQASQLLSLVLLAALMVAAVSFAADVSPLAQLSFQPSMQAGFRDTNGNYVAGTEIMHLVPYKGRLYAGNSLWMEKEPAISKACQVLVLDSPKGQWRVERQFTRNSTRLATLKTITVSTDGKGNRISPVTMLLAAPDFARGLVKIFRRDDGSGQWIPSVLGSVTNHTSTRSIGVHRDKVTGVDRILAGTDTLGVVGGVYDASAAGGIRWETSPEFRTPPGERVMGFCDCNRKAYCATSRHIFERSDGTAVSWREVYFCPKETSPVGIRGLTAVPNPTGNGEVLLFAARSKVRRLDPTAEFKETVELDMPAFLTQKWGIKVGFALAAYNEFMPYTAPETGETVWLFGFESSYPPSVVETKPPPKLRLLVREGYRWYFAAEARYFIRRANKGSIRYELAEVTDVRQPTLVAVRAIAVSPFAGDQGRAFYFGGFDCNSIASHNTAWIYRAEAHPR
ncbi:MAG: hypothetical protein NT105_06190 [Verrucomicrobia bacterium]|nr:hypothetical protein [Verrucomicrobiota bacterium]